MCVFVGAETRFGNKRQPMVNRAAAGGVGVGVGGSSNRVLFIVSTDLSCSFDLSCTGERGAVCSYRLTSREH